MSIHNFLPRIAMAAVPFLMAPACLFAQATASVADRYDFVKLDYPGAPVSFPLGINSSRQIVGVQTDKNGVNHGYLYTNGKFTDIDYPGASQIPGGGTFTGGLNDRGDVAGVFSDAKGFQHGFLRTVSDDCDGDNAQNDRCKPVYQQIDVPGAAQTTDIVFEVGTGLGTAAIGVNNLQEMVGMYATQGLWSDGFELSRGKFSSIDDPVSTHGPGMGSRVFTINDFGLIAGAYIAQASPTSYPVSGGFVFTGKEYIPVNVPGADKGGFGTQVSGINNSQEVVGVFTDSMGTYHGLYWAGRDFFILDFPGSPYSECHSINSRGDITGAYILDLTGENYRGFVAYRKDSH